MGKLLPCGVLEWICIRADTSKARRIMKWRESRRSRTKMRVIGSKGPSSEARNSLIITLTHRCVILLTRLL